MGNTVTNQGNSTILILKPDTTIRGDAAALILMELLHHGFIPLQAMEIVATPDMIRQHYRHSLPVMDPVMQDLTLRYMCCGTIMVLRFTDCINGGQGVVERMRMVAGNSRESESITETIRNRNMVSPLINSIHSSDCEEEAKREMEIWRPHFENLPLDERLDANTFVQQYIDRNRNASSFMRTGDIQTSYKVLIGEIYKMQYSMCGCWRRRYGRDVELLKSTKEITMMRNELIAHYKRTGWNRVEMVKRGKGPSTVQVVEPRAEQNESAELLVDIMIEYAAKYEVKRSLKWCFCLIFVIMLVAAYAVVIITGGSGAGHREPTQ